MASITLRSSLSRGLTNSEVDDNFTNLNNDKAENGANSDITSMSGVTGEIGDPTQIQFDPQSSHPTYAEGLLWYDSTHNTLAYFGDESGVVHNVNLEEHQKVYNNSGVTIAKGEPLYFSGNFNGYPTAARANATDVNKYNAQGIAAHSIENGTYGYVCTAGLVEGVDTSGLNAGTNFFVGLTDGAVQNASPTYPNFPMCLGWVVSSNASTGILLVNQQNHSVNSFRVRTDTHIGGDLIIDGNLTVVGEQTSVGQTNVTQGAPFLRLNEGNAIGESGTTFSGSGLDDAFFSGHFTGTAAQTYYVRIDSVGGGTGGVDTFEVAIGTDSSFSNPILTGEDITGDAQLIHSTDNISVEFGSTTGHTLNDTWTGTASPIDVDTGIWTNRNTGATGVGYTHMGMFFDVSDAKFRLVDEYDPVPTGTINTLDNSYSAGTLIVNGLEADSVSVGGNSVLTTASTGINADTLDGIDSANFLRSDQADTTTGALTVEGRFTKDNSDASSTGLRISNTGGATVNQYFNGSGSTDDFILSRNGTGGSEFRITNAGAVRLGHNGNGFKLDTTSTGISVTGEIDMGTNAITDAKVGQWDTAYGWGDHSTQGYQDGTYIDGIAYENKSSLSRSVGDGQQWVKICDLGSGQPERIYLKVTHTGDNTSCEFEAEISTSGYSLPDHILVKNHQKYNNPKVTAIRTHEASSADVEVWVQVEDLTSSNGSLIVRSNKSIPTLTATSTEPTWSNSKVVYTNTASTGYEIIPSSGVLFQDNVKASFGTGEDLKIYHNSNHSYVQDVGTGHLLLLGNDLRLGNSDWSENYLKGVNGGEVEIYHNGSVKLATTSTGVDVTGNIVVSGTVDGRDVATDGTKLDTIESGATADQSASEILTAIKTVDGASSGLDADVLDGQHGSYYQDAGNLNAGTLLNARLNSNLGAYTIDPTIPNGDRNSLSVPTLSMAAIVDPAVENKMQFAVPDVIEGSTDGGSTWTDITSNYSTSNLKDMVSGTGTSGGINITSQQYDKIRIYWNYSQYSYGYVYLNYLHIYQSGRTNTAVIKIEKKDFQTQVWSTVDTTGSHGGWPTHVWIPHSAIPYVNSNGRNDAVRIEYDFNWNTTNTNSFSINKINWYGTYPVAQHNRVSTWDRDGNFQVQGNLLVPNGTVDGRDIATDGTKLDGIEANATADQTASEIKTAYESNSDTNAFTDALLTKLNNIETAATADQTKADIDALGINADQVDGIEAASFLRSDATDSATGALTFGNTVTLTGSQTGNYPSLNLTTSSSSNQLQLQFGTTSDPDEGIISYFPSTNHFDFTVGTNVRFRMEGDGDFHADGDVIAYSTTISDRRLKSDIKNIDDAVDKVKKINGCTFKRHDGQVSAGVIAQDVEAVLPEAIREKVLPLHLANDTTTYKLVEYDAIIGLLVESVKELTARVEELENAASDIRRD